MKIYVTEPILNYKGNRPLVTQASSPKIKVIQTSKII